MKEETDRNCLIVTCKKKLKGIVGPFKDHPLETIHFLPSLQEIKSDYGRR